MNRKEFEERLERLGPSPADPDLGPLVRYLLKKVNILTSYLMSRKETRLPSGRFAPQEDAAEEASDAEETSQ